MLKVNIFDTNFSHSFSEDGFYTASAGRKPKKIEYVQRLMKYDGVTIFTDEQIFSNEVDLVKSKYKVAWCQESPAIKPFVYENITKVENKFDFILTFHPELLKRSSKYKKILIGSSRVRDEDWNVCEKTKQVSLIASTKMSAPGHILRHKIAGNCKGIDLWGSGYKNFVNKTEPLKDYMFTIAIMNYNIDNYFTEILVDCFALGVIPVFWGTPNIGEYFNVSGMILFSSIEELSNIKLKKEDYYNRLEYVKENFEIAKKFSSTDDIIADTILNCIQ